MENVSSPAVALPRFEPTPWARLQQPAIDTVDELVVRFFNSPQAIQGGV
jgi:hypothetical protein